MLPIRNLNECSDKRYPYFYLPMTNLCLIKSQINRSMKIISLFFCFLPLLTFGQMTEIQKNTPGIKVGKAATVGAVIAELEYLVADGDTLYTLKYRDASFTRIDSYHRISFLSVENAVDNLYKALKSVFTPENRSNKDYSLSFGLGGKEVGIKQTRAYGPVMAVFYSESAMVFLSEKHVDKLFGKN